MLYNQTFNLDQVSFAAEGIKDAQQTVCVEMRAFYFVMNSMLTISAVLFFLFSGPELLIGHT